MIERLKNLLFVVLGGVIVAAFSYFVLTDRPSRPPELRVEHEYLNIAYLDRIAAEIFSSKMANGVKSQAEEAALDGKDADNDPEETKALRRNFLRIVDQALNFNIFGGKWYNSVHFIVVTNNTDSKIENVELVGKFDYDIYIINENNKESVFSTHSPGSVIDVGDINPGSKVEMVAISNYVGGYNPADIVVLAEGRRQPVEYKNIEDEFKLIPIAREYPFSVFILSAVGLLAIIFLLLSSILYIIKSYSRKWRFLLTSEDEYKRSKELVKFYELETASTEAPRESQ